MAFYIIKHRNGCYWDGYVWRRGQSSARGIRHSELPETVPLTNAGWKSGTATRRDLRWRRAGVLIAEASEVLMPLHDGRIEREPDVPHPSEENTRKRRKHILRVLARIKEPVTIPYIIGMLTSKRYDWEANKKVAPETFKKPVEYATSVSAVQTDLTAMHSDKLIKKTHFYDWAEETRAGPRRVTIELTPKGKRASLK